MYNSLYSSLALVYQQNMANKNNLITNTNSTKKYCKAYLLALISYTLVSKSKTKKRFQVIDLIRVHLKVIKSQFLFLTCLLDY